jgi:hypothetical protein
MFPQLLSSHRFLSPMNTHRRRLAPFSSLALIAGKSPESKRRPAPLARSDMAGHRPLRRSSPVHPAHSRHGKALALPRPYFLSRCDSIALASFLLLITLLQCLSPAVLAFTCDFDDNGSDDCLHGGVCKTSRVHDVCDCVGTGFTSALCEIPRNCSSEPQVSRWQSIRPCPMAVPHLIFAP